MTTNPFSPHLALRALAAGTLLSVLSVPTEAATRVVFLETMAKTAMNPWNGTGTDQAWTLTGSGFAQGLNWNFGDGSPCGMQFKQGTATLGANSLTTAQPINVVGQAGFVEFHLSANGFTTANTGWAFQIDSGAGFITRLSELPPANHGFQRYHYDLKPEELVGNLRIRFLFAGGATTHRINLDQISVSSSSDSGPPTTNAFKGSIVLGRPTDRSITLNVLSTEDMDAYVEIGAQTGTYTSRTPTVRLAGNVPTEIPIGYLEGNTRYHYRLRYTSPGSDTYLADADHMFMTQRPPGSTFTFCIQGDSHPERLNTMFNPGLYQRAMKTVALDEPDFFISLGDDFSVDTIPTNQINAKLVTDRYILQRPYMGTVGASAPIFLVNGNHEQAAAYLLDGTPNNIAVWAQNARNRYFPEPAPDGFYTGNTNLVTHIGLLRNYFSWTWGDALFVVIDPYWESPTCVDNNYWTDQKRSDPWEITHGNSQYQWLKSTLEQSNARYKFVFAHHVMGTGRGGIEEAQLYEWGGENRNGTWGFDVHRPDWGLPLHQLMASNHVTMFFQGHDHIFVRQELDGVTYQTLPNPADPNYSLFNSDAYTEFIHKTNNSGYARVSVSPQRMMLEYIRTYLPEHEGPGKTNGMVAYSYELKPYTEPAPLNFNILLGRPTDRSVAVSVLANANARCFVEFGTEPGIYTRQTGEVLLTKGLPTTVVLEPLQPNQAYFYRLRYASEGSAVFKIDAEHRFQTQRARGSTFTFTIEADPHYNDIPGTVPSVWQQTLTNILTDRPDFLIDLGDTFMGEKYVTQDPHSMSEDGLIGACAEVRNQFFSITGHSVPLFLVEGNHDPELGWWLDLSAPHESPPTWGTDARELYYPCPQPGTFYSGADTIDPFLQRPRSGYYAFEWGDALIVVLDPFWYSNQGVRRSRDPWAWTLGADQYFWLKSTLEKSKASYKFVFSHHLVGGSFDAQGRGGLEFSPYFEWGGLNQDGSPGFAARRPGWPMPIRELLATNKVQVFFHGHDHLYAKQDYYSKGIVNGQPDLIYQEVPQPSHFPYNSINSATDPNYNYTNGTVLGSSGHLRVTVGTEEAIVEYIRSYRSSDEGAGRTNRMVAHRYSIAPSQSSSPKDLVALSNGERLQLRWTSQPGSPYTIERSEDLVTWLSIPIGQTNAWTDSEAPHARTRRFYRVRSP